MSLGLLATPTVTICKVAKMVFNVAPGNFYLSQYLEYQEANGTSATVEALAGLAGGTDAAFVTTVLTNLGLADDAGAQAFLETSIAASGRGAALEAAITALDNVAADDATYGAAKTAFDSAVTTSVVYSTNTANNSTDVATLTAVVDADAIAEAATVGRSFALTTGVDSGSSFTGTAGGDVFVGVDSATDSADTINVGDSLVGGDGIDTMRITTADNDVNVFSMSGIEIVEITAPSATGNINAQSWSGVTTLTLKNTGLDATTTAAAQVSNLAGNVEINLDNVKVQTDDDDALTVGFTSGAVTATGELDLNVSSVGASTRAAELVLDTNGADVFTTAAITATGTNVLSLNAQADADVALTGITVDGAGSLTLTVDGTNAEFVSVTSFDASENSGGVTVDLSTATGTNQTITGGSGADSITADLARNITVDLGAGNDSLTLANPTAGNLSSSSGSADSINGGDGVDTLIVTAAGGDALDGDTSADRGVITGFEKLGISDDLNAVTVDVSKFGVNQVRLDADTTTADGTLSGLTSGATIETRATSHVQTLTVGGTFEATDVYSAVINGTTVSHTVVAGDTDNNGIATAFAAAVNTALGAGTATAATNVVTLATGFATSSSATDNGGTDDGTFAIASDDVDVIVTMTGATGAGTPDDVLNIAMNSNLTVNDIIEQSFQVDGINKLVVTTADRTNTDGATDRTEGYQLTLDNDNSVSSIDVSGSSRFGFTSTAETRSLTTVDATELAGDLNVVLTTNGLTQGVSVLGGSGTNTITGSGFGDIIVGGSRADTLTGGDGADKLTGGAGADTFVFAAGSLVGAPSASNFEEITDFEVNSDIIDHDGTIAIVTNATASAGTASITSEGIAAFHSDDDTFAEKLTAVEAGINAGGAAAAGQTAYFAHDGDTYVFISDGTDNVDANDVLIKLTGVTGLTDITITGGNATIA